MDKIICHIYIFHLTSLESSHYFIKHKGTKLYSFSGKPVKIYSVWTPSYSMNLITFARYSSWENSLIIHFKQDMFNGSSIKIYANNCFINPISNNHKIYVVFLFIFNYFPDFNCYNDYTIITVIIAIKFRWAIIKIRWAIKPLNF